MYLMRHGAHMTHSTPKTNHPPTPEGVSLANGKSPFQVPNLDRGLSVLELLGLHPEGLILSDLCRTLQIPKKSGSRVLSALEQRGFLKKNEKTLAFSLTSKLLMLGCGAISDRNLTEEAIDVMRELRDATGESVSLDALVGDYGVVLERVTTRHPIRLVVDPGTRFELHCTAPGKMLLACLPKQARSLRLTTLPLPQYTPTTITSVDGMRRELETVAQQGYAIDQGEGIAGVFCVSAPILDRSNQTVAALTVSAMVHTLPKQRLNELITAVTQHAERITQKLR